MVYGDNIEEEKRLAFGGVKVRGNQALNVKGVELIDRIQIKKDPSLWVEVEGNRVLKAKEIDRVELIISIRRNLILSAAL